HFPVGCIWAALSCFRRPPWNDGWTFAASSATAVALLQAFLSYFGGESKSCDGGACDRRSGGAGGGSGACLQKIAFPFAIGLCTDTLAIVVAWSLAEAFKRRWTLLSAIFSLG
ncbi:unnamed protein product, partial [Phaeothamnion confervicola]